MDSLITSQDRIRACARKDGESDPSVGSTGRESAAAKRKVPIAQLAASIEAEVKRAPRMIQDICLELGYSRHAVYVRLLDLMAAGRVRYVEVRTAGGLGLAREWHPGQASAKELEELLRARLARAAVPDRGPIEHPCQVTSRTYPALRRRDPLVAALFGQAGTEGAANA